MSFVKVNNKGQALANLGGLAIGIVTLAIVVIVAMVMFDQTQTVSTNLDSNISYVYTETVATANQSLTNLLKRLYKGPL